MSVHQFKVEMLGDKAGVLQVFSAADGWVVAHPLVWEGDNA